MRQSKPSLAPVLALFVAWVPACDRGRTTQVPTTPSVDTSRDVTRPGDPPPRYRASSDGPLRPITENGYGAYGDAPNAPQLGDTIADFELPTSTGETWRLADARARGPVMIIFYRGFW